MKTTAALLAVLILSVGALGQKYHPDVQSVRNIVEKWNSGYRAMDPTAMSATIADRYDLVNRFGEWSSFDNKREEYEKLWMWVFKEVYRGKPGPDHKIHDVRRLTKGAMTVQAWAKYEEPIITSDGKTIPPFMQWVTFVVVKQRNGWRIASHNIHNQFVNPDNRGDVR